MTDPLPRLSDLHCVEKRILVRVDFNVPMQHGRILDDSRILATLSTLHYLLHHRAKVLLLSHLGRPKGVDGEFSLRPCAHRLQELLKRPILFLPDLSNHSQKQWLSLPSKSIALLENLRFSPAEEDPASDPTFAAKLANLGEIYVNEAFAASHRSHTSITELPSFFPHHRAAGFQLDREWITLSTLLNAPKRPFAVILGGSKLDSKLGLLQRLLPLVDHLFLGGALPKPFLEREPHCLALQEQFKEKLHLPLDYHYDGEIIRDIGPQTIDAWTTLLLKAKTILWNGPVGLFEQPPFDQGSKVLAHLLSQTHATTIAGGGETVAALRQFGLLSQISFVSTGGGATLELLEHGTLPGIEALF